MTVFCRIGAKAASGVHVPDLISNSSVSQNNLLRFVLYIRSTEDYVPVLVTKGVPEKYVLSEQVCHHVDPGIALLVK